MEPTMFGPYRIEGELGRGPSGVVHRARDTAHDDRAVALRILTPELSADAGVRARFLADAAALSAIREPHVVPVHAYGDIDGRLYLDMRLVRGPSLAAALAAGPLRPQRARHLVTQIGSAVEALRRAGLGIRPITRDDVLLTGAPGRSEFVQIVGLGIGGPPADPRAVLPPELLVLPPDGAAPLVAPRRRRWPVAVAIAAAVTVAAAVTLVTIGVAPPTPAGPALTGPALTGPVLTADASGLVTRIAGSTGVASNLLISELDGRPVVVAALDDATIGRWDLVTGEPVRPPVAQPTRSLALVELDGRVVLAALADDATVRMFDLDTGEPVGPVIGSRVEPPADLDVLFPGTVRSAVVDGDPVLVVRAPDPQYVTGAPPGFDPDAPNPDVPYRVSDGTPAGGPYTVAGDVEASIAPITVDGRAVGVALADTDGDISPDVVAAIDLATREPLGPPSAFQPGGLVGLATAERAGAPVAVVGGYDNLVRVVDLRTGQEVLPPLTGHTQGVRGVTAFRLGDRTVVQTIASTVAFEEEAPPTETRFWDLDTGEPVGSPLSDHPLYHSVVPVAVGDRTALVGVDDARTISVWDAATLVGR